MASPALALPPLEADLLLMHPPAVFEFRARRDIYFPFLSTSGDVPITPLYEYFPVGFKSLQRYLGDRGHEVRLLNLSSLLLRCPQLPIDAVLEALAVRVVGIDLHWLVHVQGALALAALIKQRRPDVPTLFGGISATYYAEELIRNSCVDFVMTGYDTHEPLHRLLRALRGEDALARVPNLLWTKSDGSVVNNGMTHLPETFGCGIDWSEQPPAPRRKAGLPIREIVSTHNAGCRHDCPWCGGSRAAFRRVFDCQQTVVHKQPAETRYELESMNRLPGGRGYHLYTVGCYNETPAGLRRLLEGIGQTALRSVNYEQFFLTPEEVLRDMVDRGPRAIITLSPQSHDPRVAKASGRGVYTNAEMEAWLERALELGIHGVDIWYFVGMPEQTERSVMDTVEYCSRLLERFRGTNVNPIICPMVPFLDPASNIFEAPDTYGYRVFHRTLEEHRRAMTRASLVKRINYETKWLTRWDIVQVGYRAVRELMSAKTAVGMFPSSATTRYNQRIDDALDFLRVVDTIDSLADPEERTRELDRIGDDIRKRNDLVLCGGVVNQAFPFYRQAGGRWFDELGWPAAVLDALTVDGDEASGVS